MSSINVNYTFVCAVSLPQVVSKYSTNYRDVFVIFKKLFKTFLVEKIELDIRACQPGWRHLE